MRRSGFTLLELLVVVAIMGVLGTISVGGYRAMQRGMEERGVMGNVNQFVRAAYQRAQIDRKPVMVYFWNETIQSETDLTPPVVVGKAVAVRPSGRITENENDEFLLDEFGDLAFNQQVEAEKGNSSSSSASSSEKVGLALYQMKNSGGRRTYSVVRKTTVERTRNLPLLFPYSLRTQSNNLVDDTRYSNLRTFDRDQGNLIIYAYEIAEQGTASKWRSGDEYGMEFATITLPRNFIFGSAFSKTVNDPIPTGSEKSMRFNVVENSGNGAKGGKGGDTIVVHSLRPNSSGDIEAQPVAKIEDPWQNTQD